MSRLLKASEITIASGRKTIADGELGPNSSDTLTHTPDGLRDTTERDTQSERLKDRISELEQAVLQATSARALELEALEQDAFQHGMDQGMKLGAAGVTQQHEEQLNVLCAAVQGALDAFNQQLLAVEPLALELTQLTLEKIFGNPDLRSDLVAQTTRHHLTQLTASSAVGVRVSATDFPETARLHKAFGTPDTHPTLSVQADPQLPSGACFIELLLGRLDVSLSRQSSHAVSRLTALRQGG
jgi:flagellar assembly protein FliH